MQGWAIFLIVVVILIVLALAIVATIYLIRKDRTKKPENGAGNGGGTVTPTGPTGSAGGEFSFRPMSEPNMFVTAGPADPNLGFPFLPLIVSNNSSISCNEYKWANTTYTNSFGTGTPDSPKTIDNALTFFGTSTKLLSTEGIVGSTGSGPVFVFAPLNIAEINVSWGYNPSANTWCATDNSNICLYYNSTNQTVEGKTLDSTDSNFKWILEQPRTSPNCIPVT
jgi:hypothetical protein